MNRGGVLNSIFTLLYLFSRNERWERCLMKLLSRTRAWFYFRMALGITFSNSMSQCLTSCYHAEFLQTWWSNTEIREITLAPLHTEEDTSEYLCSASVFPQLSLLKLFFFFLFFMHLYWTYWTLTFPDWRPHCQYLWNLRWRNEPLAGCQPAEERHGLHTAAGWKNTQTHTHKHTLVLSPFVL